MKRIIKRILKQTFCIHKYQPIARSSFIKEEDKLYDSWFKFECLKCHKEKTFKSFGLDKISNYKDKKTLENIEKFLRKSLLYDNMRDEYKEALFHILDNQSYEEVFNKYMSQVKDFYDKKDKRR